MPGLRADLYSKAGFTLSLTYYLLYSEMVWRPSQANLKYVLYFRQA